MLGHRFPKKLLSWFHWAQLIVPSLYQVALIYRKEIHTLSHMFATAPWRLSWFAETIMRKIVSIVAWSAQQWVDNFPCPLLLSLPLDNGVVARKIGHVPSANSNNIFSATWSQIPCGLSSSIEYHFFSEPGPMNDHCPFPNFFCIFWDDFSICQAFSFIVFRSTGNVAEHRHK